MAIERTPCVTCGTAYAPRLTRWECPVCGAPSADGAGRAAVTSDQRMVAVAIAAMVANLLLLAWLATLYLTA